MHEREALTALRRQRGRWVKLPTTAKLPLDFPIGRVHEGQHVVSRDRVEAWLRARMAGKARR